MGKVFAVIVAAGSGHRFQASVRYLNQQLPDSAMSVNNIFQPKQYHFLCGQPLLFWTVKSLADSVDIDHIIVAIAIDHNYNLSCLNNLNKNISIVKCGGDSRSQTVANAVAYIDNHYQPKPDDLVMVHDGARCCISQHSINMLLKQYCCHLYLGAILAKPINDSIKLVSNNNTNLVINKAVNRNNLYTAETPQIFLFSSLLAAIKNKNIRVEYTDEASLFDQENQIQIIENLVPNPKITSIADLDYAKFLISKQLPLTL